MIQFEIIREQEEILKYREVWNQIFSDGQFEPSTSFEWTYALLKTHLDRETFILIVLKQSNLIIGFLPLVICRKTIFGISIKEIFPISEKYNTHSDILITYLSDDVIKAIFLAISSLKVRWDIFRMNRLIETNPIVAYFEKYLNTTPISYTIRKEAPSIFTPLNKKYNEYLQERTAKFRNNLKRWERRIKELGCVEIHKHQDPKTISNIYKELIYIEDKSWKKIHRTSISDVKRQREFYEILCQEAMERGWLHLYFLYFNQEPVAYNMGLIKNKKYKNLKTSFDERFRSENLSSFLRAKLIENLIEDEVEEFDFHGEPYEWQREWACGLRWHKTLIVYNNTINGKILSMYNKARYWVKERKKHDQFEYCNPKKMSPPREKNSFFGH